MTPQEIEQILDMLIEKLGPVGGHVWSIYVHQVYIEALAGGLVGALLLLAALGMLIGGIYSAKCYLAIDRNPHGHYGAGDRWLNGIIACVIAGPTCLITGMIFASDLIRLFNPEYYAIQMLLNR